MECQRHRGTESQVGVDNALPHSPEAAEHNVQIFLYPMFSPLGAGKPKVWCRDTKLATQPAKGAGDGFREVEREAGELANVWKRNVKRHHAFALAL